MADVPQSDLTEIKRRLTSIEQRQNESATQYAVLISEFNSMRNHLPTQINAIVSDRLSTHGKSRRETSSWIIGIIAFGLTVLFSLIQIGFRVWA